ncbi:hypothetical protein HDF24_04900 [Mucilaginibacter sp. X4EP1]|jgi:hypothetical protein|uniref:hypothetical protein n=1 Tax=Mucilaginibacter sp. X4EP1 TaxID=2723092 RepID=UPI0021685845|nr:hypothetical protein [Mucilaginibacter sp. X4EP1]MCS3816542.1 hypothetical protein [Mucilaginibacter sp. X4EP1]
MDANYYLYLLLLFFVSLIGLLRYKKLSPAFKTLTILIIVTFISETIKKIVGRIFHNSMPVAHLSAFVEYSFFASVYYYLLSNRYLKRLIMASIFFMLLLEIVNIIFFESLLQFPAILLNVSQFIYVLYSLLLFRQMLIQPAEESLFKQSIFWFNLDMLLYSTAMFLDFALTSYFIKNKLDATALIYFSIIVNMLFYAVIGISILIDNKKKYDAVDSTS